MDGVSMSEDISYSPLRKIAAWGVHLFTACGAAAGLLALVATTNQNWHAAIFWMAVTIFVDSVDGTLARLVKVKAVLPQFDGALLDNIVDYFTYVIVPAYFLYEAPIVPPGIALFTAIVITLASAYQFCQTDAKTEDHFFLGFPSYWNVVVFYLFMLNVSPWLNLAVLLLCAVGVFVPIKYVYPSRTQILRGLTWFFSAIWLVIMSVILAEGPRAPKWLVILSLFYIVYYFGLSFYLNVKHPRKPA